MLAEAGRDKRRRRPAWASPPARAASPACASAWPRPRGWPGAWAAELVGVTLAGGHGGGPAGRASGGASWPCRCWTPGAARSSPASTGGARAWVEAVLPPARADAGPLVGSGCGRGCRTRTRRSTAATASTLLLGQGATLRPELAGRRRARPAALVDRPSGHGPGPGPGHGAPGGRLPPQSIPSPWCPTTCGSRDAEVKRRLDLTPERARRRHQRPPAAEQGRAVNGRRLAGPSAPRARATWCAVDRIEKTAASAIPGPATPCFGELLADALRLPLVAEADGRVAGYLMAWRVVDQLHVLNIAADPAGAAPGRGDGPAAGGRPRRRGGGPGGDHPGGAAQQPGRPGLLPAARLRARPACGRATTRTTARTPSS